MLAQSNLPASHAGEDQTSHAVFAARDSHLKSLLIGLFGAAKTLANNYLQDERDNVLECIDADHHRAIVNLFDQVKLGEALGLSLAGAMQLRVEGQTEVQLWSAVNEQFTACSLKALIAANSTLRPGAVVYKAPTIERHVLTEADFTPAAAHAEIGSEA